MQNNSNTTTTHSKITTRIQRVSCKKRSEYSTMTEVSQRDDVAPDESWTPRRCLQEGHDTGALPPSIKKIMGFLSKPKEESSRNTAFTKVTTSTVATAIGLVQAKQGLPYRTHSPSPRPLLVAEHRTPCRPDAHGRGSRPQPAPPMTHAAAPSNLC